MSTKKTYAAIDLKSFYASVECQIRGLNPLTTHLAVADESRTDKTICLAVAPLTKKLLGVGGRCRLFELKQAQKAYELRTGIKLDIIIAPPQMALYIKYSNEILKVYLRYFSFEDIHVYSIDEVFIDITGYLSLYGLSPHDLVRKVIQEVLEETGITATGGIGTNMYLAKIAMDIVAKHIPADGDGVRIAELNEYSYRQQLWEHKPLTDFWRIGSGTAARLDKYAMHTLGDVAIMSIQNPELLYKIFGIDAEILIEHVWGYDDVKISDVKSYKTISKSINIGQVLSRKYDYNESKVVVKEMCHQLAMRLYKKGALSNTFTLWVGYDQSNVTDGYDGKVQINHYGKLVPAGTNSSSQTLTHTCLESKITERIMRIFDKIYDPNLYSRRLGVSAGNLINKGESYQMDFYSITNPQNEEREERMQRAIWQIQSRFGKNALLKGTDFMVGATTVERNQQIGGHRA